jgi:predicted  nucleic acid-binding Zn-ribbon protein
MIERGCPNCGTTDSVLLKIDSVEADFKVADWPKNDDSFKPSICLNCGTIYVSQHVLNMIRAKEENAYA